jgi:hypothetical protein
MLRRDTPYGVTLGVTDSKGDGWPEIPKSATGGAAARNRRAGIANAGAAA